MVKDVSAGRGISRNVLKFIAIFTITVGHFFLYTLTTLNIVQKLHVPWRGILCYVCFVGPPIFMFFISEGFQYTRSKKKYGKRLLLFALITQVAHAVTTGSGLDFDFMTFFFSWNVFFALFLGFIDLCILNSEQKTVIKIAGVLATMILSYVMKTEWWVFGQLIIITFYYLRKHNLLKFIATLVLCYLTMVFSDCEFGDSFQISFWSKTIPYYLIYSMIGVALVSFFYKGKNGTKNKFLQYFFYVFYPLHLVLIHVVNLIAG